LGVKSHLWEGNYNKPLDFFLKKCDIVKIVNKPRCDRLELLAI